VEQSSAADFGTAHEIGTGFGPARVRISRPATAPLSVLLLGHGAGGDVDAPDLVAVTAAAVDVGVLVVRVTQPYRVAGRRAPAPARQLDEAWLTVLAALPELVVEVRPLPLIVGGRSSGARVACRTAVAAGAAGIVALAFPTHPPGRPERSRLDELRTGLPTLVVNGDRDPFGLPPVLPGVDLAVRAGERHDLKRDPAGVGALVTRWLGDRGWAATPPDGASGIYAGLS